MWGGSSGCRHRGPPRGDCSDCAVHSGRQSLLVRNPQGVLLSRCGQHRAVGLSVGDRRGRDSAHGHWAPLADGADSGDARYRGNVLLAFGRCACGATGVLDRPELAARPGFRTIPGCGCRNSDRQSFRRACRTSVGCACANVRAARDAAARDAAVRYASARDGSGRRATAGWSTGADAVSGDAAIRSPAAGHRTGNDCAAARSAGHRPAAGNAATGDAVSADAATRGVSTGDAAGRCAIGQ